jgi:transposase InsO family protein
VEIVERWVLARLRHYRFYSLAELNKAIAELIADLTQRPFKRLEGNRREWFERLDQSILLPLPVRRYEIATFKKYYIHYYNHDRIKLRLRGLSPVKYRMKYKQH